MVQKLVLIAVLLCLLTERVQLISSYRVDSISPLLPQPLPIEPYDVNKPMMKPQLVYGTSLESTTQQNTVVPQQNSNWYNSLFGQKLNGPSLVVEINDTTNDASLKIIHLPLVRYGKNGTVSVTNSTGSPNVEDETATKAIRKRSIEYKNYYGPHDYREREQHRHRHENPYAFGIPKSRQTRDVDIKINDIGVIQALIDALQKVDPLRANYMQNNIYRLEISVELLDEKDWVNDMKFMLSQLPRSYRRRRDVYTQSKMDLKQKKHKEEEAEAKEKEEKIDTKTKENVELETELRKSGCGRQQHKEDGRQSDRKEQKDRKGIKVLSKRSIQAENLRSKEAAEVEPQEEAEVEPQEVPEVEPQEATEVETKPKQKSGRIIDKRQVKGKKVADVEPQEAAEVEPQDAAEVEPQEVEEVEPVEAAEVEPQEQEPKQKKGSKVKSKRSIKSGELKGKEVAEVEPQDVAEVEPQEAAEVEPQEAAEVEPQEAAEVEPQEATEVERKPKQKGGKIMEKRQVKDKDVTKVQPQEEVEVEPEEVEPQEAAEVEPLDKEISVKDKKLQKRAVSPQGTTVAEGQVVSDTTSPVVTGKPTVTSVTEVNQNQTPLPPVSSVVPPLGPITCDGICIQNELKPVCATNGYCMHEFPNRCSLDKYSCKHPNASFRMTNEGTCAYTEKPRCTDLLF